MKNIVKLLHSSVVKYKKGIYITSRKNSCNDAEENTLECSNS